MRFRIRPRTLNFLMVAALLIALPVANAQQRTQAAPSQQPPPGAAYQDGFNHGKADAQNHMPSYADPGDQWSTGETQSAYSLGYGAGYAEGSSNYDAFGSRQSATALSGTENANSDAARIGYEDGRVAGRRDLDSGNAFRPVDSEMYKNADRGWNAKLGDKDHYKQQYREAYARGYQEGYGNSPTTY